MSNPIKSANDRGANRPIRIFISYAREDEEHRKRLEAHLSPLKREGLIEPWHDRMIEPGMEWAVDVDRNLVEADIVLLLISADFVASDYCFKKEMAEALRRHSSGDARIVPIFVRPTDFAALPFAKIQGIPRDAKPVSVWTEPEEAWLDVARGIRRIVESHKRTLVSPIRAAANMIDSASPLVSTSESITSLLVRKLKPTSAKLALSAIALIGCVYIISLRFRYSEHSAYSTIARPNAEKAFVSSVHSTPVDMESANQDAILDLANTAPDAVYRGTLIDESTGKPIHGATVWLWGTSCEQKTTKYGLFSFSECRDENLKHLLIPQVSIGLPGKKKWCRQITLEIPPKNTAIRIDRDCEYDKVLYAPNLSKRDDRETSANQLPRVILLSSNGHFGRVLFNHYNHVQSKNKTYCGQCHHPLVHFNTEAPWKCHVCHKAESTQSKIIRSEDAFHISCQRCHSAIGKGPTSCRGCHH